MTERRLPPKKTKSTCQHLQSSYGVYPVSEAERPKN